MTKIAEKWFAGWANEYDETLGKYPRHHLLLDTVVKLSRVKDGDRVLDVGAGTGLLSLEFLKAADCHITAFDLSDKMMSFFRKKIKSFSGQPRVKFKVGDAAKLPFKKSAFDTVASTVTLHHLKDPEKLRSLKRAHQVLKPGGQILIGEIDLDTTGNITDLKRLNRISDYMREELSLALKAGGPKALSRMFDNCKKHLFNDGEYCVSSRQWAGLLKKAGFGKIKVKPVPGFSRFKVIRGTKT